MLSNSPSPPSSPSGRRATTTTAAPPPSPLKRFRDRVHAGEYLASLPAIAGLCADDADAADAAAAPPPQHPPSPSPSSLSQSPAAAARVSHDVVVLALPRGGLPVAFPIAERLRAPLDLLLVRKLGFPGNEEVAMGALSVGNIQYLSSHARRYGVTDAQIERVVQKESAELKRRNDFYRAGAAPYDVAGKTVVVVDDGVATGATMTAAVMALRTMGPRKIVVASPVGAPDSVADLRNVADDVVVPLQPSFFQAVGQWYTAFPQTEDDEVMALLERAKSLGLLAASQ
ncbi:phosphoribosyltransferase-like protein [Zopfochytrium polystomum]|nr:phosphoribosyltransferase-like protein [Zopfochytrium polystomum]